MKKAPLALVSHSGKSPRPLSLILATLCCSVLMLINPSQAQDVYEGFDYLPASDINGLNGGSGWAAAWGSSAGSGTMQTEAGSLIYPLLPDSGGKIQVLQDATNNQSRRSFRNLQVPLTDGTHYIRFKARQTNTSINHRYFGLALFTAGGVEKCLIGSGTGFPVWTVNRVDSGEVYPPGHPLEGELTNTRTSGLTTVNEALLVVKLVLKDGFDEVTFWVNPDLSQPERAFTSLGGAAMTTTIDFESIARVRIGGGNGGVDGPGDEPAEHFMDEIYIGPNSPFADGPEIAVEEPEGALLESGVSATDFGHVWAAEPQTRTYTIRNTGTAPLNITSVAVTGPDAADFSAPFSPATLAPDESTTLAVTFTPGALEPRSATLTIASDDFFLNDFIIDLTGEGDEPALVVEQPAGSALENGVSTVDFGNVPSGFSSSRTFVLRNTSGVTLSSLSVNITGDDFSSGPLSVTELGVGEDVTLQVHFEPATLGLSTGTLSISSNDPDDNPFIIGLTGEGVGSYGSATPVTVPGEESEAPPADPVASWSDEAAGLYDGLLRDADDSETLLGAIESLKLGKAKAGSGMGGAASAKLRLNGRTVSVRGTFDSTGLLNAPLPQKDGSTITLNLQLMRTTDGTPSDVIRGTVTWDGATAVADLPRAPYTNKETAPPALIGKFTLLLPAPPGRLEDEPGGDGWATVNITKAGGVRLTGLLGDGVKWTESAFLSAKGEFSIFAELYKSKPVKGRVGGKLVFRPIEDVSDFDGKIQWVKFSVPGDSYPAFTLERWAVGSRFEKPAKGAYILEELTPAYPNTNISFWGSLLTGLEEAQKITRVANWETNHKLTHYGPEKLSAKANANTGAFTGSYRPLTGGKPLALKGVVFQKQNLAGGVFLVPGASGLVRAKPDTSYPYPGSEDAGDLAEAQAPATPPDTPGIENTEASPAAAGVYVGVITDVGGESRGGLENFKLNATGSFSATLWLDGVKYPLLGQLEPDGSFSTTLTTPDGPVTVSLQLGLEEDTTNGYQLTGTLDLGSGTLNVDAQILPAYTTTARAPEEGSYTVVMIAPEDGDPNEEPGGDGYGTLKVDFKALCKGALVLADGTKTTFSGHISRAGEWSLHRPLYGAVPQGFLAGKLTFRTVDEVSDVDGSWSWVKSAGAAPATVYPGGFNVTRAVTGSQYTPPPKNTRAWAGLVDDWYNAWFRLSGPDMSTLPLLNVESLDRAVTWTTANKVVYYGPEKATFKVAAATGLVTGSFQDTARGIKLPFGGVLLQKQGVVSGAYVSQGRSGRFVMQPRP